MEKIIPPAFPEFTCLKCNEKKRHWKKNCPKDLLENFTNEMNLFSGINDDLMSGEKNDNF